MSRTKYTRIIFFIVLYSICLNKNHFGGALTEEQRREIEALHPDLNTDFEKHEEEQIPTEKGVVLQPDWLQDGKIEKRVDANVVFSDKEPKEAQVLRAEIHQAVSEDDYIDILDGNSDHVQDLIEEFSWKQNGKDALRTIVRSTEKPENEEFSESVGAAHNVSDDYKDGPNIVEASATLEPDIDIRKLQRLEVSKRRTREVLVLQSIEEDYSFDLGNDIDEWEHILHDGEEYFIGRRKMDLLIVRKNVAKYQPGKVVQVGQPISYLETYSYWNLEQRQQEGVMLVASKDKVLWYVGDNTTGEIEFYWEWVVGNTISGLTYFTAESIDYLVVSSNESSRKGYYTLNIYQFELHTKEFWISQRIQLKHPCGEVTVLDTGRDIILAVAQNNTAAIYGFNRHADATDHIRFRLRRTIESEGVALIAGFQMGGRSYLALGGQQPQILLYQQGDFVPKTILGHNFGFVELFFPIPVRTYRDDLILLVQHYVDFGTHGITVLETLIWDGEAFEASIPVPCQMGQQIVFGVNCMLDLQRDEGLKGAALLRRGDEVSIIVPRQNAESGLFRLHTQLLGKNSELIDLQEIYSFLKDWVEEQNDLTAQALTFLNKPDTTISQAQPDFSELESLKTTELCFDGDVAEIHVNDYKWTDEDTRTTLDIIMNTLQQLESDLAKTRLRRDISPNDITFDILDLNKVHAKEVFVDHVNNEEFFIQNGTLAVDGILNFQKLQVLEEVKRENRGTIADNVEINGDIEFLEINGMLWTTVMDNMVFRNMPLKLEKLQVVGEVIVEDRLTVNELNSLNFPDDYFWSSGPAASVVKAEKTFSAILAANSVDTDGTINGINPMEVITLSDSQDWKGLPTFAQLEVAGKLELNGTAHSRNFDSIPDLPTLKKSKTLKAICNFDNLEVRGNIYLNGNFDKTQLAPLLANVVQYPIHSYKDILISSKKIISFVTFPVDFNVSNNKINEINVTQFVPKHTKQDLNISELEGYILFNNLTLSGLYDGINIRELLENSIKIDEPKLSAQTHLNFVNVLYANTVNVATTLNGIQIVEGYQTIEDDLVLPNAYFENLGVRVIDIPYGVLGNAQFNGLNLPEFLQIRNWSAATDTGDIHLDELFLQSALESDEINGIESEVLLKFLHIIDDMPEMILDGKIQVDRVIVTEEVQVNKLNGYHFDEDVQLTAIWLNRPNYLSINLQFVEPLQIYGDLIVDGVYNNLNLPDIIDDMVFRTANSSTLILVILAPKTFIKNVKIVDETIIKAINNIPFAEIATKQTIGNYKGILHLNGYLGVSVLDVTGYFNKHSMSELNSLVHFDTNLRVFVQHGVTTFMTQMQVEDLTVFGNVNGASKLGDLFWSFIYKNDICILKGKNTFTGRVSIESGAHIRSLNGYNLLALLNNIVFVHDGDTIVMRGPTTFGDHVNAKDVIVKGSITTSNLDGCSLKEWCTETLRVDQHREISKYLQFSAGSINGNLFYVSFLNNIDLSQLITLHTAQNLSSNLRLSKLYLDGKIVANGLTNGFDLQFEYANTLLINGDQHVLTPLTIQSTKVVTNLQTNTAINNDKDLQQLALLKGNIKFESPLFFQEVSARNLHTNDFVSGINLKGWFENSLWLNKQSEQWITGNWSVGSLALTAGPSLPSYLVDGMPTMTGFNTFMRTPRDSVKGDDELCQQISQHISKNQSHAYYVKYLQESFTVDVKEKLGGGHNIKQAFVLGSNEDNYLLVNIGCNSYLYEWNIPRQKYIFRHTIESGSIAQVILIQSDKNSNLEFVINTEDLEEMNCNFEGLSAWNFNTSSNMSSSRSFSQKVSSIHSSIDNPLRLYAIEDRIIHEISFNRNNTLDLPKTASNESYRFSPLEFITDIMLINDEKFILLKSTWRQKRSTLVQVSPPITYQPSASLSESVLKPNASFIRKYNFSDFKHVVENILTDLINCLHLEVNITQLSIPESDLYGEHLTQDFKDIMQELQRQQLFSNEMFAEINLKILPSLDNTAKVLAARVVQIVWPALVEIDEVHNYLRGNQTYEDPICTCITNSMGFMLRDVLLLAYRNEFNDTQNIDNILISVIERVYKFQSDLGAMTTELQLEIKEEQVASMDNYEVAATHQSQIITEPSNTVLSTNKSLQLESNDSWLLFNNAHFPRCKSDMVLSLQVGSALEPRTLFAIISQTSLHLVAGQHDNFIKLYTDFPSGSLLQSIPAHKPRSLTSVRIHHETLLVYIEGCCSIHVLIYRGVQGFIKFSKFKMNVEVIKVIGLSLLTENLTTKYYLATVLKEKFIFYEIAVAESKNLSKSFCTSHSTKR